MSKGKGKGKKQKPKRSNNRSWASNAAEMLSKVNHTEPTKDVWGDCK